ncbi:MAG TPA: ABC transporter permease [Stellaceae bacterium]|nr:ABC transporter permease [Stellaceae bacterium]
MSMATVFRYTPLLICVILWQMLATVGPLANDMLPNVPAVMKSLWGMIQDGSLYQNGIRSLIRCASGLAVAIVFGISAGMLMATFKTFRLLFNPIVQIFYPMPKSALIPVTMVWFGLGDMSKIALIFIGCLLPIVISTYNGARGVNPFLIWSARSFGASRLETLWQVVLPAAMPEVLNGIRTALAFSFILVVSAEFVIAEDGVGYMIGQLGDGGSYAAMFAVILVVCAVGFAADRLFAAFVRYQLRWREP